MMVFLNRSWLCIPKLVLTPPSSSCPFTHTNHHG